MTDITPIVFLAHNYHPKWSYFVKRRSSVIAWFNLRLMFSFFVLIYNLLVFEQFHSNNLTAPLWLLCNKMVTYRDN